MGMRKSQSFRSTSSEVLHSAGSQLTEGNLGWLGGYLKEHILRPEEDLEPLLNTVLVFTRARTATLQNVSSWKQVSSLAKKLNASLDVDQSHHRLELVRRGPKTYFVTCANSPRFNWKVSLSHQDVGENLDYFAPGHMAWDTKDMKAIVYMVETSSFEGLTGEWVLLDYLDDERCRVEWKRFNRVREALFNEVLAKLGLEYRVKCLVVYPGMVEAVQKVMVQSKPPSPKWWENYCYFVNGFLFPGIPQQCNLAFCGFDTNYEM